MKKVSFVALLAVVATPVFGEDNRQLDAHEHGVGQLDIAFDGEQIAMELHAPGADIVGFEYAPESAEDRAAVDGAVAALASPLTLFELPEGAGCSVVQASAELESEGVHEAHDDHKDEDHADHDDEHKDKDHADHDHEAEAAGHTEFHAEYLLNCANPELVTEINFAYFEAFPNALEVEVQVISDTRATAFEVERDAPSLDLRGAF